MIYTGRAIDAETACASGLVNRVVPAGGALESAIQTAKQIADSAPMAVRMAKLSTSRGQDCDSATAYALDMAAYNVLVVSGDTIGKNRCLQRKKEAAMEESLGDFRANFMNFDLTDSQKEIRGAVTSLCARFGYRHESRRAVSNCQGARGGRGREPDKVQGRSAF
jgi:hypothetical protein